MALRGSGKIEAAVVAYGRALGLNSAQPGVLSNAGNALKSLQRFDDSIALHRRAVAADPESSLFASNLGVALREAGRILQNVEGVDAITPYAGRLPDFDVHCPLMGLPRFFVRDLTDIPPPTRLYVPLESRPKLAPALRSAGNRLKVGIVWSGSVTFKSNHLRSTTMERFLRLAAIPGVQLFSLQKGPRANELAEACAETVVTELAPLLNDFADTAAAIAGLDLVIMTDSSVAHLTGSLGRPIWNLLPKVAYWL